jgi:uncharacterized paraquat-inducible protein A
MNYATKGLCCQNCGHQENVAVIEGVLELLCPKCGTWVSLGKAFGLTPGQAVVAALILWGLFG